jgi:hypothetical protein
LAALVQPDGVHASSVQGLPSSHDWLGGVTQAPAAQEEAGVQVRPTQPAPVHVPQEPPHPSSPQSNPEQAGTHGRQDPDPHPYGHAATTEPTTPHESTAHSASPQHAMPLAVTQVQVPSRHSRPPEQPPHELPQLSPPHSRPAHAG